MLEQIRTRTEGFYAISAPCNVGTPAVCGKIKHSGRQHEQVVDVAKANVLHYRAFSKTIQVGQAVVVCLQSHSSWQWLFLAEGQKDQAQSG